MENEKTERERSFNQEYLAEFMEDSGSVFRNDPGSGHRIVMAVDWGRDIDFTSVSVFNASTREQLFLDRFNQVGWAVQRGRLAALVEKYKPSIVLAEENSIGSVNIEALQAEGIPVRGFTTTGKSKMPLIEKLALAIEKGNIKLLNDPVL